MASLARPLNDRNAPSGRNRHAPYVATGEWPATEEPSSPGPTSLQAQRKKPEETKYLTSAMASTRPHVATPQGRSGRNQNWERRAQPKEGPTSQHFPVPQRTPRNRHHVATRTKAASGGNRCRPPRIANSTAKRAE